MKGVAIRPFNAFFMKILQTIGIATALVTNSVNVNLTNDFTNTRFTYYEIQVGERQLSNRAYQYFDTTNFLQGIGYTCNGYLYATKITTGTTNYVLEIGLITDIDSNTAVISEYLISNMVDLRPYKDTFNLVQLNVYDINNENLTTVENATPTGQDKNNYTTINNYRNTLVNSTNNVWTEYAYDRNQAPTNYNELINDINLGYGIIANENNTAAGLQHGICYYQLTIAFMDTTVYPDLTNMLNLGQTLTKKVRVYYAGYTTIEGTYEVIDIPGLMFTILGMPLQWISTAFNLTIFPGTPYAINIGHLYLAIMFSLTLVVVLKLILGSR